MKTKTINVSDYPPGTRYSCDVSTDPVLGRWVTFWAETDTTAKHEYVPKDGRLVIQYGPPLRDVNVTVFDFRENRP